MYKIEKKIPFIGSYDVIVAGAGPAGICAAMASARLGSKVALVERFGTIGGNITVGHVGPFLGSVSEGTLKDELNKILKNKEYSVHHDIEKAKIALMNWVSHENIHVFLNSPVSDVIKSGNTVEGIVISTQSGMKAIKGKIIIDATGDGLVSYLADAPFEIGREQDGLMQPVTIMFTLTNIDISQTITCCHEEDDTILPKGSYLELCRQANKEGKLPPAVNIVRLYKTQIEGERMVNATQLNHIDGSDNNVLYSAQLDLRNQMETIVKFLKEVVPGYENCRIKDSSDSIGVRETRRILGGYILSDADVISGRKFEDVMVHKANFSIDIHNPDGAGQAESDGCPVRAQAYDIPYRCFVPQKIDNLFTAGRCISGTHRAHASYRVMNICMAMGEAVGNAASFCAQMNIRPRNLDYHLVQDALAKNGVDLFSE